jgi:Co/Zn/Cd efflux system component
MNGPNPPAAGHSHHDGPEPVVHVHPDSINVERGHNKEHSQDHDRRRGHTHDHDHGRNPTGVKGLCYRWFVVPHNHDAAESIDDALEASTAGVRAVKISLILLVITATVQIVVVVSSGSVALLADTIHNFSDALTAVPLWVAFVLSRRAATRRYTYGYGRVEDLAGLFIVAMIALSAVLVGYESIRRFFEPQPLTNLGLVLAAGLIGFAGNELVAVYRIRVGRRIRSAALVADGLHARTDGFTSLAVVLGVIGVWAFPAHRSDCRPAHQHRNLYPAVGRGPRHRAQAAGWRRSGPSRPRRTGRPVPAWHQRRRDRPNALARAPAQRRSHRDQ